MKTPGQQFRITDEELSLIKNTFANNEALLKLMRKLFLPELDPNAPINQNIDLWMTLKIEDLTPEQAIINLKARNTVIQHLESQLMNLQILAGSPNESVEDTKKRLSQDSTK